MPTSSTTARRNVNRRGIVDSGERSDACSRPLLVDERQLQAGRASVDDEDVQ
jgi:hypothetical protein